MGVTINANGNVGSNNIFSDISIQPLGKINIPDADLRTEKHRDIRFSWTLLISMFALFFSVASIAMSIPSLNKFHLDYAGLLVAVLSILVTLLVAWQIYKTIEIDNKINQRIEDSKYSIYLDFSRFTAREYFKYAKSVAIEVLSHPNERTSFLKGKDALAWFFFAINIQRKLSDMQLGGVETDLSLSLSTLCDFTEWIVLNNIEIKLDMSEKDSINKVLMPLIKRSEVQRIIKNIEIITQTNNKQL